MTTSESGLVDPTLAGSTDVPGAWTSSGAVGTEVDARGGPSGFVLNQEARRAGDLVGLPWRDLDGEDLVGEVRARKLVRLGQLGLVLVDPPRGLVLLAGGEAARLQALFLLLVFGLAGCVVVGG